MEQDPKFWEWLKNRDKVAQPEEQPRLELELPMPLTRAPGHKEEENRGVCVIDLY